MAPRRGRSQSIRKKGKDEVEAKDKLKKPREHEGRRSQSARKGRSRSRKRSVSGKPTKDGRSLSIEDRHVSDIADDDSESDLWSIILLLLLYTLQGIPMGLSSSIPFILQEKVL